MRVPLLRVATRVCCNGNGLADTVGCHVIAGYRVLDLEDRGLVLGSGWKNSIGKAPNEFLAKDC